MTRLAKEIPTDSAHPIKGNKAYIDNHTPLPKITKNREKRKFSPLKYSIPVKNIKKEKNPEAL
jgi:hypothetical protein